jgi:hypothetical protein
LSGFSVAGAGDVNGDGVDDIVIGAYGADSETGETYVVFGKESGFDRTFAPAALNSANGFVIEGIAANDFSGRSVAGAGDVNGEGVDDIVIGAYAATPGTGDNAGETYVVFGKETAVDDSLALADLDGTNGFVITGVDASDLSGISVAGAGDVNGDGVDDIVVGAYGANQQRGKTYVVFGKETGFDRTFALADLNGANGFVIEGINAFDFSGYSVAGAGDVNGDGLDDIVIGAYSANSGTDNNAAGETYVVFGKETCFDRTFALADLNGANGFVIQGINELDFSGRSVASAGDVNGDGVADILIGANQVAFGPGEAYVVFGKETAFDRTLALADLDGENGFVITGAELGGQVGSSVAGAGDVNGDGVDDIVIGAFRVDSSRGKTYVVFGKKTAFDRTLALTDLDGMNGFAITGVDSGDFSGSSVAGAGDVNGDGVDDIVIGAYGGNGERGETYVVFGKA